MRHVPDPLELHSKSSDLFQFFFRVRPLSDTIPDSATILCSSNCTDSRGFQPAPDSRFTKLDHAGRP